MIKKNTKENNNMNPVVKYLIIALTTIGVAGASIFMVYRSNEVKQASQVAEVQSGVDVSLLNDKSEQVTTDVDNLAKELYENYKDQLKEGTTLEDWVKQFKIYYESLNDETEALNSCLNYFAPDTLTAEDVDDPSTMSVSVDEDVKAIVDAEMFGDDEDITEEVTTEVDSESAASSATTDASTDTVTADDFEIDYYDESKTMYAIRSVNVRKGPSSTDYDKVKTLSTNDSVTVIGVVNEYNGEDVYWTVVKIDDTDNEYFISGVYLSDNKVSTTTSSSSSTTSSGSSSNNSQQSQSNTTSSNSTSSGNQSAWDILNTPVNHDYTPTIDTNNGTQVTEGGNWGN